MENLPVGRYDIQASFVGYESAIVKEIIVSSGKETFITLSLKENLTELNEVVVTPQINKQQPINNIATTSARMLSVEESSRYAGKFDDPARLVTSFAGVAGNVSSNGIAIRGNSPQFLQWKLEVRLSYQGGDRYSPIDESVSETEQDAVFETSRAYEKQLSPAFTSNFTVSYKINKKKLSHEFALKIINATGYKEYDGHIYNYK